MKTKTSWSCSACGHTTHNWAGKCPGCLEWNSLEETILEQVDQKKGHLLQKEPVKPLPINTIPLESVKRIQTNIQEFDRLVGGGIVPGGYTLIGGDPGIGKSTLMLQLSAALTAQGLLVLYVCGEESPQQTSLRARRLGINTEKLLLYNETELTRIEKAVQSHKPDVLIIDSIQIIYKTALNSSPGSVAQVRECATELMFLAKGFHITTFLIGHVTKSGEIAGPRVLEHLVDTVLYFEGDKQQNLRLIRTVKNRFGSTDEVAVFQMQQEGLKEISSPSKIFIEGRQTNHPGSVITPALEGSRALLVETQALATATPYSTPTRRSSGLDSNRLALLFAVLEKKMGLNLHRYDLFVSIAGGLKIVEPGIDLSVLVAIASSLKDIQMHPSLAIFGEVGLSGEVRATMRSETRLKECLQMGFSKIILPEKNLKDMPTSLKNKSSVELIGVENVKQAIQKALNLST